MSTTTQLRNVTTLARAMAQTLGCIGRTSANPAQYGDWCSRYRERLEDLQRDFLPHGSGIDGTDTPIDMDSSTPERLVFGVDVHDMDDNGYYCGWLRFRVTVRASLEHGLDIRVTGKDSPRDWRDYLADVFGSAMGDKVGQDDSGRWVAVSD